jgi:AcrR family transcriptional regulator
MATSKVAVVGPNNGERSRNRRGDGLRLRSEIVAAAMEIVETSSASAVTLRAVARQAQISAPAIYLQFQNREQIMLEVIRRAWSDLARVMANADSRAKDKGAYQQLVAQVRAYLRFALASPTRYELLFDLHPDSSIVDSFRTDSDQVPAPVYRVLRRAVARCRDAGFKLLLDRDDDMTILVFVVAHGRVALAHAVLGHPFSRRRETTAFVEDVLKHLVQQN